MLGLVGAAAGLGNFAGNATGARLKLGRPALIVLRCTASVWIIAVIAALTDNLMTAALATLIASAPAHSPRSHSTRHSSTTCPRNRSRPDSVDPRRFCS